MVNSDRLVFRVHAIQRMFERQISEDDVKRVLLNGHVIENYPDDTPYPSRLYLGWQDHRPLHVVAAYNEQDDEIIVITAYVPDPKRWNASFEVRKR
jgi:hypothetical protein